MEKVKPEITDSVAETLFITLYIRSEETKLLDGIISDPKACEIVDNVDYDFSHFVGAKKSAVGTVIRVRHFDRKTKEFIDKNANPIVVLIGCGLDTRYYRVPNSDKAVFYEIDLPEVIDLREKFIEPADNDINMRASMLDTDWIDTLKEKHPDGDFIFILEGVLMYFTEEDVYKVVSNIAGNFPKSELHFDAVSVLASKNSHLHDTVKYMRARFKWGLDDELLLEKWAANIKHVETTFFMNQEKARWGRLILLFTIIPAFRKAARLLHYQIL